MTILIDPTRAAALAAAGESENPLVFWENRSASVGTLSTSVGTELESAALSATGSTYDAWIATGVGATAALQLVLPSSETFSCIAIAAHNIADLGGTVQAQYSTNSGSTWQDCGAGPVTPTDNQSILFYFDDTTTDYWRIAVTGVEGLDVEIAVAFWGNLTTLPVRIYQGYTPPIVPTNVVLYPNRSQGGERLNSAIERVGSSASANLTYISPSFIRGADFKGFMKHHNEGGGFFWAWRPTKYGDVFYADRGGDTIKPTNSGPNELMSFGMEMRFYDNP